jgi:hypothetical protein
MGRWFGRCDPGSAEMTTKKRHAELVSASILQNRPMLEVEKRTLKQVQGDVTFGFKV